MSTCRLSETVTGPSFEPCDRGPCPLSSTSDTSLRRKAVCGPPCGWDASDDDIDDDRGDGGDCSFPGDGGACFGLFFSGRSPG
eukprot:1211043-Rhodomonas_salina.2